MSGRRSRRTRGEKPELVPPKSDEEPEEEEEEEQQVESEKEVTSTRGRRRGKRSRSGLSKVGSSSSLSQLGSSKKQSSRKKTSKAPPKKKGARPRGRAPKNRAQSPTPSESSISGSASDQEEEDKKNSPSESGDSDNDASNDDEGRKDGEEEGQDDGERDTEDDAPKEALTGKKKGNKKTRKKQHDEEAADAPHPRYKNTVKIECRHCGKLCFSQGIKIHEKSCMPVYTPRDQDPKKEGSASTTRKKQRQRRKQDEKSVDASSASSNFSDDTSSPPSPVVIVRKKAPEKPPTVVSTDPSKPYICRNCSKFFTPRGINAHEKRCMPVYEERESMEPDIEVENEEDESEKEQEDESMAEEEASENEEEEESEDDNEEEQEEDEDENDDGEEEEAEKEAPPNTRYCKHCGEFVSTRGFMQHERSCAKKAKNRKGKGEPAKKRKRKLPNKGGATTDDDSIAAEDDGSSKGKADTSDGEIAQDKSTKKRRKKKIKHEDSGSDNDSKGGEDSSSSAADNLPKKRGRKPKSRLVASADDATSSSDEEKPPKKRLRKPKPKIDASVTDSLSNAADNPPKKRGRKPKLKSTEKEASDDENGDDEDGFDKDDLLPISALANKKSTSSGGRTAASKKGKVEDVKDGLATVGKKKRGKTSKLAKAATKSKISPITDFFAPKSTKLAKEDTESEIEDDPVTGKEESASTITNTETSTGESSKSSNEAEESTKTVGGDEGQDEAKGEIIEDASEKKNALSTEAEELPTDENTAKKDATVDENSEKDDDSEKKKSNESKVTPSARPTRKRKLTMKAAEAAATAATKNEVEEVDNTDKKAMDAEAANEEKPSSKEDDKTERQLTISNSPLEQQSSDGSIADADKHEKTENRDASKDQKATGSIVEKAKSAAAATLAAFSLFAPKSKSTEANEKVETMEQATESSLQDEEKPEANEKTSSSIESKLQSEEASQEDTKMKEYTDSAPAADDTTSKPTNGAISSNDAANEALQGEAKEAPVSDAKMETFAEDVSETSAKQVETIGSTEKQKTEDQNSLTSPTTDESQMEEEKQSNKEDEATNTAIEANLTNAEVDKDASSSIVQEAEVPTMSPTNAEPEGSISDTNTDAMTNSKLEIPPGSEEILPIKPIETKADLPATDMDKSLPEAMNGEEDNAKLQESISSTQVPSVMTNGSRNPQSDKNATAEEPTSESKVAQKSEEKEAIESSQDGTSDKELARSEKAEGVDQPEPRFLTGNNNDNNGKDVCVDEETKQADMVVDEVEKAAICEGEKEMSQQVASNEEVAEEISHDVNDDSENSEKNDTEHSAELVAEVKVNGKGEDASTILQDEKEPEKNIPATSKATALAAEDAKEEKDSSSVTPENGTSMEPQNSAESEPKLSEQANDSNGGSSINEIVEDKPKEMQVSESDKNPSIAANAQAPDKSEVIRRDDVVMTDSLSKTDAPSSAEKRSTAEEENEDPPKSAAIVIPGLESSIDWKETVSIEPKLDNENKDEVKKVTEDRSTATTDNAKNDKNDTEDTMDALEEKISISANLSSNSESNERNNGVTENCHKIDNGDKIISNAEGSERVQPEEVGMHLDDKKKEDSPSLNVVEKDQIGNQPEKENTQGDDNLATSSSIQIESSSMEVDSVSEAKTTNDVNESAGVKNNDGIETVEASDHSGKFSIGKNNAVLPNEELKSSLETVEGENRIGRSDISTEGGTGENSTEVSNVVDSVESKANTGLPQTEEKTGVTEVDESDATRKDVSAVVESLLNTVESRENQSALVTTDMDIESSEKTDDKPEDLHSKGIVNISTPVEVSRVRGAIELDSMMAVDVATEVSLDPEDEPPSPKEELKVSWVAVSKAPRQAKFVKKSCNFNGFDESKTNRVKMILYTTGSKVHRGRGFERIFSMYWDAVCLRLSRPLNGNAAKHCDEAISTFLKSKKLQKIHNKFVMSIMRRALKDRVPYSEVCDHIPANFQDRVKVPHIISSKKKQKKKTKTFYDELEDNLLQLSSVPHLDDTAPYKERWEFPTETIDEIQKIPQEGPTVPIASSCIPGALVVDPMLRETVEAGGMKVSDNAMWLLTVALKEHIKNILNDSIEYKKGLKKGEVYPQAIHYPNVLASNSNKNRKISKGRNSSNSLDNGRKKRINSIDLFAALNMLPSGQPSSIGGSVSRMSLEQTFLSGFNSIPSFDTGNAFKDVQSFMSSTLTDMAKHYKPEEKKPKPSQTKAGESSTSGAKATSKQEEVKTPTARQIAVPSNTNTSESIATPIPSLESPPLMQSMSPGAVPTPVLHSTEPKVEESTEKQKDSTMSTANATGSSQVTESKASVHSTNVENPVRNQPAGGVPSKPVAQRSGAGRGAKNLAALMARAAETTSSERSGDNSTEPERRSSEKPTQQQQQQQQQPTADPQKQVSNPGNNGESSKPTNTQTTTDSSAPQEPIPPVRRGKGKGFGSKDLIAMRARSMTSTQTEESNDSKPAEK